MCESLLGKSLVQTPRSMSSISVSKGSSVISSVLCVAEGFPEGRKRLYWIYNIISLSLMSSIYKFIEVIRGRPAEFMKCSVLSDELIFTSEHGFIPVKLTSVRIREREGRWKWWEKAKYLYVRINVCGGEVRWERGVQRNFKSLQTHF